MLHIQIDFVSAFNKIRSTHLMDQQMNNKIKHLPVQRVISVHELGRGWLIIAKLCHHPVWKMPLYSIVTDHRATV